MSTVPRERAPRTPDASASPAPAAIRRHPADMVWLGLGGAVLLLSALPIHAHSISAIETDAFRLVNDLPSLPFATVWVPMQLGNFLVVPAVVAVGAGVRLLLGTPAAAARRQPGRAHERTA